MPLRRRAVAVILTTLLAGTGTGTGTGTSTSTSTSTGTSAQIDAEILPRIQADLVYWRQMVAEHTIKIDQ